jgi:hypothetical protein
VSCADVLGLQMLELTVNVVTFTHFLQLSPQNPLVASLIEFILTITCLTACSFSIFYADKKSSRFTGYVCLINLQPWENWSIHYIFEKKWIRNGRWLVVFIIFYKNLHITEIFDQYLLNHRILNF